MTLGSQFLKAVITQQASAALRDVDESLFLPDDPNELALYRFVRQHSTMFGGLPTQDAVVQAGFTLPIRAGDNITYYIEQLRDRRQFNIVSGLHTTFFENLKSRNMREVRTNLHQMLHEMDTVHAPNQYSDMAREVMAVLVEYEEFKWAPSTLRGVTSGWPTCDAATLGFQGGDLVVIVGRPGMGKSYLLIESAHAANLAGHSAMIMSMEMSVKQLAMRWLARKSGVNPLFIRQAEVSTWGENRMRRAVEEIQGNLPPVFLEAGDMEKSIDAVEDMFLTHLPDIIYLDSAYLFSPSGRKQGFVSRWEAITSVINDLKKLALRINRAIVITVQFNRNVKSSGYKEMDMSDIGDSDAIPRNASIILGARKHKPPFHDTKRYLQMMKNRDGDVRDFATDFCFAPVGFQEVAITEDEEDEEPEEGTRRRNPRSQIHLR